MLYKKFSPAAALRPYVMCYYSLEHHPCLHTAVELHALPSGTGGLVVNYGNAGWVEHENGESRQTPPHFIAGQFRKNYTLRLKGRIGMVGVVFWPAALPHLLGVPMIEFTGQRVDLSLIVGGEADVLREQIVQGANTMQRIRVLERFLLTKLHQTSPATDLVDCAVHTIIHQKGMLSIRQLSDDLCISPRQFRRRFTEKVGVSPKLFARIKRFNHVSSHLAAGYNQWSEMVYQGGYYDQSHFIRDFCDFSGRNPSEFVNYKRRLAQLVDA